MTRPFKPFLPEHPGAPWILDLFCGAGGASVGYWLAGFNVVGVDIEDFKRYPFSLIVDDALTVLRDLLVGKNIHGHPFVAIHASPPCQAHSDLQKQSKREYPDLIGPTREALRSARLPWVIENVEGAPLRNPVMLCGASPQFPELRVIRHRIFETNFPLAGTPCPKKHPLVFTFDKRKPHFGNLNQNTSYVQVTGGGNCTVKNAREAMGISWMTKKEINEAIPPAYTEWVAMAIPLSAAQEEARALARDLRPQMPPDAHASSRARIAGTSFASRKEPA